MQAHELVFPVSGRIARRAWVDAAAYRRDYDRSLREPDEFWRERARNLEWFRAPTRIRDVSFAPDDVRIRWFEDGVLNASVNCLARDRPTPAATP